MSRKKQILLVEDNCDDVALMKRALRKSGLDIELTVAEDGERALRLLHNGAVPDLIVLDLQLPKYTGHEVLRRLRKEPHSRYVPVVMLTSSVLESDLTRAYDYGANSYLRKPLELKEFEREVQALAHYWCYINRVPPLDQHRARGGLENMVKDSPLGRFWG
jgi:two-component system response regulator